jgi:hypothetical protein
MMTDEAKTLPVKKKRGSKQASIECNNTCEPGEISKIVSNSLYWYKREIVKTDEECIERLNEYFTRIIENDEIPTVEKMCLALGTTRNTVWEWEQGYLGSKRGYIIKKAKEIMASLDAELVSKGKIPQITYIFRAKNFFGMQDKQEYTLVNGTPLDTDISPEDIRKRLSNDYKSAKDDENEG